MSRIFITGSSDGLGQLAAVALVEMGHEVVWHARNEARANDALRAVVGTKQVLIGDLSDLSQTKKIAEEANSLGHFDAIIHNAGVYRASEDTIFNVNTLAPYVLTALMHKPKRLIYLTSGLHRGGHASNLDRDFKQQRTSYSDSRFHTVVLSMAVARLWPDVFSNAVNPGWVPTKMGGASAPDSLESGYATQVWLAVSEDPGALVSGRYFHHMRERSSHSDAADTNVQDKFLQLCELHTGISFQK